MTQHDVNENDLTSQEATEDRENETAERATSDEKERLSAGLQEANDKYLRLYAEFENYKKRVNKDKEELIKFGNESLLFEILPVLDNLEMALKHARDDVSSGLVQGVEITLRELKKTLRKFGLSEIEAEGKPFAPLVHHAISQVERSDVPENIVVEEYRKGYMLKDKVLRASLVAVSRSPSGNDEKSEAKQKEINNNKEEES
jgi:molecular chaperone GrpE